MAVFLSVAVITQFFPAEPTLIVGVLWWVIVPYFLWHYTADKINCFASIVWQYLVGIMVFVPCFVGLIEIQEKFGARFLLYLLMIVCAADIGAYFSGRLWGKHSLAPQISPKKTLEGVLGGLLLALLVAVICDAHSVSFLMLVVVTCLWSVIGDLFESMLKRQAGVKDSGKLLPGHGGMYDRIDSLTAAIPIFVLGLLLI